MCILDPYGTPNIIINVLPVVVVNSRSLALLRVGYIPERGALSDSSLMIGSLPAGLLKVSSSTQN